LCQVFAGAAMTIEQEELLQEFQEFGKTANILLVGPFVGSFTPNARIPLDTGLCGAAASTRRTVVVDDVRNDPRYLAGSSMVISEIVVPISVRGTLAAELDIESYFPGTFTKAEQEFVEACAKIVEKRMSRT
jgi:L-methionine (R)-S-oxide reductase